MQTDKIMTLTGCICSIGAVGAAIIGSKRLNKKTLESDEPVTTKEKITCYMPAIGLEMAAIGLIVGSDVKMYKKIGEITGASAIIKEKYDKIVDGVVKNYGKEGLEKILDVEIARDVNILTPSLVDCTDNSDIDRREGRMIFVEDVSGEVFESTFSRVLEAEYHLNRNYNLSGCASMADFHDFLGIHSEPEDRHMGWRWSDGVCWLDFSHVNTILEDGTPAVKIVCMFCTDVLDDILDD